MDIVYSGFSDIGKLPDIMEDFIDVFDLNGIKFMCIADGLGGKKGSHVASNIAIYEFKKYLSNIGYFDYSTLDTHIQHITYTINKILVAYQMANPNVYSSFSTTLTVVAVDYYGQSKVYHIGNTRAYLIREGTFHQLTRDDTIAQELAEKGEISFQEINNHPERAHLTKVLGSDNSDLSITVGTFFPRDTIIMMTNGVYEVLSENDLRELLLAFSNNSLDELVKNIIKSVNEISGIDNSALIVATLN